VEFISLTVWLAFTGSAYSFLWARHLKKNPVTITFKKES